VRKKFQPTLSHLGEFGLIDRIRKRCRGVDAKLIEGIGDDCAVYSASKNRNQVITTDALVEGVHFDFRTQSAESLGRKALAVNLSDLAAMGAEPRLAVLALGLPSGFPVERIDALYRGLSARCRQYRVALAGGDTVRSPRGFWIALTLVGETRKNRWFRRSGARPGQVIWVSGTLGDSALGLRILSTPAGKSPDLPERVRRYLTGRHLEPEPRLALSQALVRSTIRVGAMIDLSDGLLQDLGHVCRASGVGARLQLERIPVSQPAEKFSLVNNLRLQDWLLGGGEDYELLFTTPREDVKKLKRLIARAGVPVTEIGTVLPDPKVLEVLHRGRPLRQRKSGGGFDHFR